MLFSSCCYRHDVFIDMLFFFTKYSNSESWWKNMSIGRLNLVTGKKYSAAEFCHLPRMSFVNDSLHTTCLTSVHSTHNLMIRRKVLYMLCT